MGQAMANIVELVATITGRIDSFRKAMSDGAEATDGFSKSWSRAGADIAASATRIGTTVGTMVGGITTYLAKLGVQFNASQETSKIMFTTLLGDAELAKKKMAEVQKLSTDTPFSFSGIRGAAVQFLNAKVSADDLIPRLRAVGDAVSAIGGSDEELKGVSLALSQMMTSGRLNSGDVLQLSGRGIAAWDMLASHFGKTVAEVRKMSESGQIDGREAADAIMRGMAQRFDGASAQMGKTLTGVWSSLKDTIEENAGTIFMPLTNGLKKVLTFITGSIENSGFQNWVKQMQVAVGGVIQAIERFASKSGTSSIEAVGNAFLWGAKGATELLNHLRIALPWIQKTTAEYTRFLVPIGQWIAKNPDLVAGIVAAGVAFKGLQLLGLVSAFTSLIGTIGPTIGLLTRLPALLIAIQTAVVAASGPMLAFFATPVGMGILVALALVAAAFAKVAAEAAAANAQADRLDKKFADQESKKRDKVLKFQGETEEETLAYLQRQRDMAEKNRVGLEGQARGASKDGSLEEGRTQVELVHRAQAAEDFVAAIDARIAEIGAKAGKSMVAEAKQEMTIPSFQGAQPNTLDKQALKDEAKKQDTADNKVAQFQEKLLDLKGTVPTDELQAFAGVFAELRRQFLEGEIYADQYRDSLKWLDNRMRDASQVGQAQGGLADHTQSAAERLDSHNFGQGTRAGVSDSVLGGANKQFDAIEAAGMQVANAFKNGQISATQYAQEMQRLKKATDEVTEAAIKEEQQKRKEALLKNDFKGAGLDFNASVQQKIEDRLVNQKMSEFDNAVDNVVNQFFPLSTIVQTVSDGFTALDSGLSKAGDFIGSLGSGGSGGGGNDSQAQQNMINYLTSQQGKVDSYFNEISFLQQAITALTDPTRIKELTDSIANLNRQIAAINNQVHTFTGHVSNDPIFRDPGITGGGGNTAVTINQHIPNVQNFSQSDMDHIANRVADVFARQGNPTFR